MQGIYVLVCYFLMIVMPLTIKIPIIDTTHIMGYTLRYFIFYAFTYSYPLYRMVNVATSGKALTKNFIYTFIFMVMSSIASIVSGGTFVQKTAEAVLFCLPIALCSVAESSNAERKKCLDWLLIANIISGVISFLVAIKLIKVDIWAADDSLVRTAGAVNSTLGIGGFAAALVIMFISDDKIEKVPFSRKVFEVTSLVCSALVVLFSLSRTRIVVMLALCAMLFVYNLVWKGSIKENFKMVFLLIFAVILIIFMFPDVADSLFGSIQNRYQSTDDQNVTFRTREMEMQMQYFLKYPLTGLGWGARTNIYIGTQQMYVHNIFTALLMHTGIAGTFLYLLWYFGFFGVLLKEFKTHRHKKDVLIGLMFFISLTILGFTNSGHTQSGAYFMMFYIALLVRDIKNEEAEREAKEQQNGIKPGQSKYIK